MVLSHSRVYLLENLFIIKNMKEERGLSFYFALLLLSYYTCLAQSQI